jgi:hypothetical protein
LSTENKIKLKTKKRRKRIVVEEGSYRRKAFFSLST